MEDVSSINKYSAVDPTLGYLYQVRVGLLLSLQRLKDGADFIVSIEALDDVVFKTVGGDATDLLQLKHHRTRTASLNNTSADLWKTLRIWFEGYNSGSIPMNAKLFLVTTGKASNNSAAGHLRITNRDVDYVRETLDSIARSSTSKSNQTAYSIYLRTAKNIRTSILNRIVVIDAAPQITELDSDLRKEIYWAAGKDHHSAFLERMEGWWYRRVVRQLCSAKFKGIGSVEIEAQMSDLREQFKQESLPIDDDILDFDLDDAAKQSHKNNIFVKQIEITNSGKRRIAAAIRDYLRAYQQRSRWLREDLIVDVELTKYEKRLIEEWSLVFEAVRDELGDEATAEAKEKAARSVLMWAERTLIPIRPYVTEPFVCRGSLHMLSDDMRIGWHPEFNELLSSCLSIKEGA